MIADTMSLTESGYTLPAGLYILGTAISLIQSLITGDFSGNFYVICLWACVVDSLVIWLVVYVVFRTGMLLGRYRNRRA